MDAREKQREERQMEAAKRDMLVYKQMVFELKAVLAMKKDKKSEESASRRNMCKRGHYQNIDTIGSTRHAIT